MLEGAAPLGDAGWRVDKLDKPPDGGIYLEFVRNLSHHRSTDLNESADHPYP